MLKFSRRQRIARIHEINNDLRNPDTAIPDKRSKFWWYAGAIGGVVAVAVMLLISSLRPPAPLRMPRQPTILPVPQVRQIRVTNLHNGDILRYPVALVCGSVDFVPQVAMAALQGRARFDTPIQVTNRDHPGRNGATTGHLHNGLFRLLVELSPGKNRLLLSIGKRKMMLGLTYTPSTSPYQVVFAYVIPADGSIRFPGYAPKDAQDYKDRLDTAAKLMQTFTAERMNELGMGPKTFNLELDKQGRVVVHTLRYPASAAVFRKKSANAGRALWDLLHDRIIHRFPDTRYKTLVIPAIDGLGGGRGGGGMGLLQAPHLADWPRSLADVARAETDLSTEEGLTEIGMGLHELGHCFGADHSADPNNIMADGCYYLGRAFTTSEQQDALPEWAAYDAAHFYYLRCFQPDKQDFRLYGSPNVWIEGNQLKVRAHFGIGAIQVYSPADNKDEAAPVYKRRFDLFFKTKPPQHIQLLYKAVQARAGASEKLYIVVTDTQGNATFVEVEKNGTTSWPMP